MNKLRQLIPILVLLLVTSCNAHKKYSDFDYSYSRSGGFDPVYENFLIKGTDAHYSFEGQGRKVRKDYKLSAAEIQVLEDALAASNFRMIQEDRKKLYDNITTSIVVKKGANAASKSDASFIMPADQHRWNQVVKAFEALIASKTNGTVAR